METEEPEGTKRARAPIVCFLGLTCLNALFWLTADFGSFVPPSDGPLAERVLMFSVTESGPFAFPFLSSGMSMHVISGIVGVSVLVAGTLLALVRNRRPWPFLACAAICLWLCWGFCVAGIRVT